MDQQARLHRANQDNFRLAEEQLTIAAARLERAHQELDAAEQAHDQARENWHTAKAKLQNVA